MAIEIKFVKIFVEGDGDRAFIRDILKMWYNVILSDDQLKEVVIICKGYNQISKHIDEFRQIEIGQKREGGKNIVIFDADYEGVELDHGLKNKIEYLKNVKNKFGLKFETFLFPDNQKDGTLETMLESCINQKHKGIMECWQNLEECVKSKGDYTMPADKSKIYVYLECLHSSSKKEKDKIKDSNRNYTLTDIWIIDYDSNPFLQRLKSFFDEHLSN